MTGATGLLGGHLLAAAARRSEHAIGVGGPSRRDGGVDLADRAAVEALFARVRPDVVIHAAALAAIADCARDPELARRINVEGTSVAARAAAAAKARFVYVSTDLVFDGEHAPYAEDAATGPTSVYGRTKRDAELEALAAPGAVVVRVSLLFGPTLTARKGFFDVQLEALRNGTPMPLFTDEWRTPLSLDRAAEGLLAIASSDATGTLHFGGPERMSRYEMGVRLARVIGVSGSNIVAATRTSVTSTELRPRDVALDSSKLRGLVPEIVMGSFEDECRRMLTQAEA